MDAIQLTERLIHNTNILIHAKKDVRSPQQMKIDLLKYKKDRNYDLNHTVEENMISLTCYVTINEELSYLANCINKSTEIFEITNQINLDYFSEIIFNKKSEIINSIEDIKNSKNVMRVSSPNEYKTIFEDITETLDFINSEAIAVEINHKNLISKRKI